MSAIPVCSLIVSLDATYRWQLKVNNVSVFSVLFQTTIYSKHKDGTLIKKYHLNEPSLGMLVASRGEIVWFIVKLWSYFQERLPRTRYARSILKNHSGFDRTLQSLLVTDSLRQSRQSYKQTPQLFPFLTPKISFGILCCQILAPLTSRGR